MADNHERLDQFKKPDKVNSTPLLKDLYRHITPHYALDWKVIGTLLDIPTETLNIIEHDCVYKAIRCCNAMFEKWLEIDTTASWKKLFAVMESLLIFNAPENDTSLNSKPGLLNNTDKGLAMLSDRISQIYVQTRFIVDRNSWPPEQPKIFTPLLYIHYQGNYIPDQVAAVNKLMCTGEIGEVISVIDRSAVKLHPGLHSDEKLHEVLDTSTASKEIENILAPLEHGKEASFILIEGAPGIGKSVLLKEIAYRWGKKQLLQKFDLVLLLCLRDPSLQQASSVNDLLQLFCRGEDQNSAKIVNFCSKCLFSNNGKSLTLLLDGYDECPRNLQESGLIADIIERRTLPLCGLVISSRPHASEHLRQQATIRVDILGFTETERQHYITHSLQDQPHKIKELTQYLRQQSSIDSICFIPFNMAILLYLYKLGVSLPKNSTELYHYFICSTICRHLSKFGKALAQNITDLTDLPKPYNTIIHQLSKLSLDALYYNKLVFTLDEVKEACPEIVDVPGAINGFGLLQAVQHFGLYAKTMTINFIHFTIQEFLAAHYISHLPPHQELVEIEAYFGDPIHFNVLSLYTSLTKGQRPAFKQFLQDGNKNTGISPYFLKDQLKSLLLYRCFNEADDHKMCKTIEQAEIFNSKILSFNTIQVKQRGIFNRSFHMNALTASDIECISVFLASSCIKEWMKLKLSRCYIQDIGLKMLCRGLHHDSGVIINQLHLEWTGLTMQSSALISELTVKCKVKVLKISDNNIIGENEQLYSMLLNPFNVLEQLYMVNNKLSSTGAIKLFRTLKYNNKLKELNIAINSITDDACDEITTALKLNSCLVTLSMYDNPLKGKAITNIVQCLEDNDTLQLIEVPQCPQSIQDNIVTLVENINKKRESKGCQKLKINI